MLERNQQQPEQKSIYKTGGSFNYTDKIAYTPDMAAADVMVKATGMKGKTTKELGSIKVADGTIVTPLACSV